MLPRNDVLEHISKQEKVPKYFEQAISDSEIRKLLQPKSVFDVYPRALVIMKVLLKFNSLPTPILTKATGYRAGSYMKKLAHHLVNDGYISLSKGRGSRNQILNVFTITKKGRIAIKSALKKQKTVK